MIRDIMTKLEFPVEAQKFLYESYKKLLAVEDVTLDFAKAMDMLYGVWMRILQTYFTIQLSAAGSMNIR